jgi:hypothetical protein
MQHGGSPQSFRYSYQTPMEPVRANTVEEDYLNPPPNNIQYSVDAYSPVYISSQSFV